MILATVYAPEYNSTFVQRWYPVMQAALAVSNLQSMHPRCKKLGSIPAKNEDASA